MVWLSVTSGKATTAVCGVQNNSVIESIGKSNLRSVLHPKFRVPKYESKDILANIKS